jgi:hypothetical protein
VTPKINLYVGSLDDAYTLICQKGLTHCDPVPDPLWAYSFADDRDLILFVLDFGIEHWAGGNMMLIPERCMADAEAILRQWELSAYVHPCSLFWMEVWGEEDEAVLDAVFGEALLG